MIKYKPRIRKALSLFLAFVMIVGLMPVFHVSAEAASGTPADMDALGALGIDSSKAPDGFDAHSTDNPYGRDIVSLGTVFELYTIGLKNTAEFSAGNGNTGKFRAGGDLSLGSNENETSGNKLQALLYGHNKWNEDAKTVSIILNNGESEDLFSGTTTTTAKTMEVSSAKEGNDFVKPGDSDTPYNSYLIGAENITTNLGDDFDYGMSSVAAGHFVKEADGLKAQTVMVYTSDYSGKGGLYLRFGDAVEGGYGASKKLLEKNTVIGNPELTHNGEKVENFAESPYQLQNYLQVATGDWNGDGIDEVAVYVPEPGKSRIEFYALQLTQDDDADAYKDPSKWGRAWTYYFAEGDVVSNMVSLVSGDMNKDGIDDLAATWGYYYGPQQNKGSTAVVMFGAKGSAMLQKDQSFPLTYGTSNLVRASFAFGDMAGGKEEDTLILCAQSDADLLANKPFTRYVALYNWNGKSFISNISKNFDLFEKEKKEGVDGAYEWIYTYGIMTKGRGGADKFYSQPLCAANTAVLRRGVESDGGDLLYFDSLIFEYTDEGLTIKEPWDITGAMQKYTNSPTEYVEYSADAGDLTGQTGASALFTMTQTLATTNQKHVSYNLNASSPVEVPKYRRIIGYSTFLGNWLSEIIAIIFGSGQEKYVKDGKKTVTGENHVDVYYDEYQKGQTYLVAVDPTEEKTEGYYVNRKEVDFSTSLCLVNTDNDSSYMKYGGEHYFAYSDPEVLAVLASPPYFADLLDRDDLSGSYGDSSTSYSSSTGSGGSTVESSTISVGAYVSFEQEISFFGISAGKIEAESTVTAGFTWETETSSSLEQTVTYQATVGEDMVAFYSIPMEIYKYTTYVPDGAGGYSEVITTVNIPHEASVRVISLEDYESIAEDYSILPKVANNVLTHTVGDPSTYPTSISGYSKPISYIGDPAKVDFSSTGGSISQEIAMTEEESKSFTITGSLEFKAGGGAGGITVGVVAGGELGEGTVTTTTSGSSFSGELFNMPLEAKPFGYTMNWKIFSYLHSDGGRSFPVVNYLVSEVHKPAPLPEDFVQNVEKSTDESITLNWSYEKPVAGFNLYRYYEFPDGSGSYQIDYIPYNEGIKEDDSYKFEYEDTGLSPYTEYLYQIQTVQSYNPAKSIQSEPLICRTKTMVGYPVITVEGLDEQGLLPIFPDSIGTATATVKDASDYKSLSYQWQKLEDGSWKNLSGYSTNELSIANAGAGDKGIYRCRVNAIYYDMTAAQEYHISAYSESFSAAYSKRAVTGKIKAEDKNTILGDGTALKGLKADVELYSNSPGHAAAPTGTVLINIAGTDYSYSQSFGLKVSTTPKDLGGMDRYYSTAVLEISDLPDGVYTVSAYYGGSKVFKDLEIEQEGNNATVVIGNRDSYVIDLRKEEDTGTPVVTKFTYGDCIYPTIYRISKDEGGNIITEYITDENYEVIYNYTTDPAVTGGGPPPTLKAGDSVPDIGNYVLNASIYAKEDNKYITTLYRKFMVNKRPVTISAKDKGNVSEGTVTQNEPIMEGVGLSSDELDALKLEYTVKNSAGKFIELRDEEPDKTYPGNYTVTPCPGVETQEKLYKNYEITYVSGIYTVIGQTYWLTVTAKDYTDQAGTRKVGTAGISNVEGSSAKFAGGERVVLYAIPEPGYEVDTWTAIYEGGSSKAQEGGTTWTLTTDARDVSVTVTFKASELRLFTGVVPTKGGEIEFEDGNTSGAYVSTGAEFELTATPREGYHFKEWQVTATDGKSVLVTTKDNGDGTNSLTVTIGTATMTVYAHFERDNYTLTLGQGLQAYYTKAEEPSVWIMIPSGGKVPGDTKITVKPTPGYTAVGGAKYIVNGEEEDIDDDGSYIFAIQRNSVVSLDTQRENYAVITGAVNGRIVATVDGVLTNKRVLEAGIIGGSALKFVPYADRGYIFDKWKVNDEVATADSGNSLNIPALAEKIAVEAIFEENIPYTVTASVYDQNRGAMHYTLYDIYDEVVGSENMPMSNPLKVYHGEKVVLSVRVNSGSMIEQWKIGDINDYTTGKTYALENIEEDITATAYLKASSSYKVNFIAMGEGDNTLSAKADRKTFSSGTLCPGGSELCFFATPAEGQMLDYWTITDGDVGINPSTEPIQDANDFDMAEPILKIDYLRKNMTVRAYFTELEVVSVELGDMVGGTSVLTYATPVSPDDNGELQQDTKLVNVRKGGTIKMKFKADEGYKVDAAVLESALEGREFTVSESDGVYTIIVADLHDGLILDEDNIFIRLYKINTPLGVTASHTEATAGEEITLTVIPFPGYLLLSLDLCDAELNETVSADTLTYTFIMPEADVDVMAEFESLYKINTPIGVMASLPEAKAGKEITLTVTPPTGKQLLSLTLDKSNLNEIVSRNKLTYTFTMPAGDVWVTVKFETIPTDRSNGSGGSSRSGSSSGSGDHTKSTVPAADGAVRVEYDKSGNAASLDMPKTKLEEIIEKSKGGEASLDLSGLENVISVELPKNALTSFEQAGLDVTVKLPDGMITLDREAAASVSGQASGEKMYIGLMPVTAETLNAAQKEVIKTDDVIVDISIRSEEQKISSFDGMLTIGLPYTGSLPVAVWYLNNEGELEKMDCSYKNGIVTFTLDHLSLYVMGEDSQWVNPFDDVKESNWFYGAVEFVHKNGLMNGVSDKLFAPRGTMTRGMIVTILHRMEETPRPKGDNFFDDVAKDKYYFEAVIWAAENKLVNGYGNGKYGPEDAITREQLAVILLNYAKFKGYNTSLKADLSEYDDGEKISTWVVDAMAWANSAGLIQGDGIKLLPAGNAERSQVAAIIQRFINTMGKQ